MCLAELARAVPMAGYGGADSQVIETFKINKTKIKIREYLMLMGDYPSRYRFSILDTKGNEEWFFALGTYNKLTNIIRELGGINSEQRIYHLSSYKNGFMKTYRYWKSEPTLKQLKSAIYNIIANKSKSQSSVSVKPATNKPDVKQINNGMKVFRHLKKAGKNSQAVKPGNKTLSLLKRSLGSRHRKVGSFIALVAANYYQKNDMDNAETSFLRAAMISELSQGQDTLEFAYIMDYLSIIMINQNRLAEAEPMLGITLATKEKKLGKQHEHTLNTYRRRLQLLIDLGKREEADKLAVRFQGPVASVDTAWTTDPETDSLIHNNSNMVFPKHIGPFKRGEATAFDKTATDVGVKYHYGSGNKLIRATIYAIIGLENSVREYFDENTKHLSKMYSNTEPVMMLELVIEGEDGQEINGLMARYYTQDKNSNNVYSELYVFKPHNVMVKIRIDYDASLETAEETIDSDFLGNMEWPPQL